MVLGGLGRDFPIFPLEWTGRDLNPRPPRCQRGDHTRLIYQPSATLSTNRKHLSIMPVKKEFEKLFCLQAASYGSGQMSTRMSRVRIQHASQNGISEVSLKKSIFKKQSWQSIAWYAKKLTKQSNIESLLR